MTRDDRVFYWAISIGEGLIVFMVTWLLAARASEWLMPQPAAAISAMSLAVIMGTAWSSYRGLRRVRHVPLVHTTVD
ncbi:MAG: hypothetical protein IT431_18320 [Phycisphaerales bacterium]|nr:hypothetical protein [Phycisphaerales bacterium]